MNFTFDDRGDRNNPYDEMSAEQIMEIVYRDYGEFIQTAVQNKLASINVGRDDQDDCAGYVIEKLFEDDCRRIRKFKGNSTFKTYLASVCRNLIVDYLRKLFATTDRELYICAFSEFNYSDPGIYGPDLFNAGYNPEAMYISSQKQEIVERAYDIVLKEIGSLPPEEQLVVSMRLRDRCSYTEINSILGIANSQYIFTRALRRLRFSIDSVLREEISMAIEEE